MNQCWPVRSHPKKVLLQVALVILVIIAALGRSLLSRLYINVAVISWLRCLENSNIAVLARDDLCAEQVTSLAHASLELSSSSPTAHKILGFSEWGKREYGGAKQEWAKAALGAAHFTSWGKVNYSSGYYSEALDWFQVAAELEPESSDLWFYVGLTLQSLNQYEQALSKYHLSLQYQQFDKVQASDVFCEIGWLYHWLLVPRDPDQALKSYQRSINENNFSSINTEFQCLVRRGDLLLWALGDYPGAASDYVEALNLIPDDTYAQLELAIADYLRSKDAVQAKKRIQKIIQADVNNYLAYQRLGDIYMFESNYDEACKWYEKALELASENPDLLRTIKKLCVKQ